MEYGKLLILFGTAIMVLGFIIHFAPWLINWFGKLPGDIRSQNNNSFVFIPITSMIVVSIILTIIVNLFFRK